MSHLEFTYWAYCYDRCRMRQFTFDTYDDARGMANEWMYRGLALVHITEMRAGPDIKDGTTERLIWAAATPELDWR